MSDESTTSTLSPASTSTTIDHVGVRVFATETHLSFDSDGHAHPGPWRRTEMALLTITDSEGVTGYALGSPHHLTPHLLDQYIRPVLVTQDPVMRERLWIALARWQRGSGGLLDDRTLALVELALWDLAGRRAGEPVWRLLGGYRDRVPAYASIMCGDEVPGWLATPQDYAEFARDLVAQGYRAIKLHTWMPPVSFAPSVAMDIAACAAVREAVGPDVALMLDANHWYSRAEALTLGRAMDDLGFAWFEEPMEETSMQSYRWLADQLATPVIGPESVAGRFHARAEWIRARACDILRVGVPTVGGIGPAMKTMALAESFGMDCELHGGGSGSLHVLGAVHNSRWYERGMLHPHHDYDAPPPHLTQIIDPLGEDGQVAMPTGPGLGDALDLGHIASHTIAHH